MNDDVFVRKDVADEREKHTFEMIANIHRRIDDMHNTFSHILTVITICFAILALGMPFALYYIQSLPH